MAWIFGTARFGVDRTNGRLTDAERTQKIGSSGLGGIAKGLGLLEADFLLLCPLDITWRMVGGWWLFVADFACMGGRGRNRRR
jgi:hypothetical protein